MPAIRGWADEQARTYDHAAKGGGAEKAVWNTMLEDEALATGPFVATAILLNLVKCYEHAVLHRLWWFCVYWQGPLDVIGLAMEAFNAPRCVKLGDA